MMHPIYKFAIVFPTILLVMIFLQSIFYNKFVLAFLVALTIGILWAKE